MSLLHSISPRFSPLARPLLSGKGYEPLGAAESQCRSSSSFKWGRSPKFYSYLCCLTLYRLVVVFTGVVPIMLILSVLFSGIPPNFEDIRAYERSLPQHHFIGALGERQSFIRFPDHVWGHGLNNVLQEAVLLHYIALKSNRSYVFEDYIWSHLPFPYIVFDLALRPTRLPLNAFISGPTAGGATVAMHTAVNAEFWEKACKPQYRYVISSKDAPQAINGSDIVDWWVSRLKSASLERCVEIDSSQKVVFDSPDRMVSLWKDFSSTPILTGFLWSPLVQSAVLRNFPIFRPNALKGFFDVSSDTILTGLVAVHVRHGDYRRHCARFAGWRAGYNGLNQLLELPDKFDASPYIYKSAAYNNFYMKHCLPTVEQVVERLRGVRKDHPGLNRVYVLTNAWSWWLSRLKQALLRDEWDGMRSTLDIELDSKQKQVLVAVDMAIAERAEVFVGNGFSSLTSNVVMLRLAKGIAVSSNRFL